MKYIFFEENEYLVDQLIEDFQKAEHRLKTIERSNIDEGIDIPAINELRYAASHIISTFKNSASLGGEDLIKTQKEAIRRAIRHTQRASYDAIESGILSQLYAIKSIQDDYKDIMISVVIKDWIEILGMAQKINNEIQEINITSEKEESTKKEENYELIYQKYMELDEHTKKFGIYRDELNKYLNQKKTAETKASQIRFITFTISGTALLIGLIQLIIKSIEKL